MSLHPEPIGAIPAETVRVAQAAFPKGTVAMRLRDAVSALYSDADFAAFYPARGQCGLAPWRLALVTIFQFLEQLSDRQAADAVHARIDWKYALELTDPGFHFSVLTEFRARLVAGGAEHLLLDRMLDCFKAHGLVRGRGKQRTDSTYVLAAVHDLHLLELVAETLRAALDDLAAIVPDWLRALARGSPAMGAGSRTIACPSAGRSARRSPLRPAQTGLFSSMLWTPRMHRLRPQWWERCARCGGYTMRARGTGRRAGGQAPSCRPLASGCSRPTTPRRITARSGRWSGRATRCTSPRPATRTPRIWSRTF